MWNSKPTGIWMTWFRKLWGAKRTTIIRSTLGETEWDFVNGQGLAGWCLYQSGNPFEANFIGQSTIKPIRGDKILIKMKSGKVGRFQIYWFMPLFKDNRWKARACFIGYNDAYKIRVLNSELPTRYRGNPASFSSLVAAAQALDGPSLEKLAASYPRPTNHGVRGPRPAVSQLSNISSEPVSRSDKQRAV